MEFKDCTVGTKVQIKGTICEVFDKLKSVALELKGGHKFLFGYDFFERDVNQYDPKRKFRKGDIVRPDYKGRKWAGMLDEGIDYKVLEDESHDGQVLITIDKIANPRGWGEVDFSRLVLIKPIEKIKLECPYYVDESCGCFDVRREGENNDKYICSIYFGDHIGVTRDKALEKAEELCDEKNREYRESLKN